MVSNGVREPRITTQWVAEMDRLMRLDGRPEAEVEAAIRWCQRHPFWRANILSPRKLREKYDTMRLQAERDGRNREPRGMAGIREFLDDEQV
jgi:alkanesulfonate monooxygenase SsuD/methylene tetrahydromethanopterin reductase-like flavin-dependent oxidoreductase (luciferase family)